MPSLSSTLISPESYRGFIGMNHSGSVLSFMSWRSTTPVPLTMILSILLLVTTIVHGASLDPNTLQFPPTGVVGPYRQAEQSFMWANVISPPELVGSFMFQAGQIGTAYPQDQLAYDSNGVPSWTLELVLPHSSDISYACQPWRTTDELGQNFTGKMLLTKRGGGCASGTKLQTTINAGAVGMIQHGCETFKPFSCSKKLSYMSDSIGGNGPANFIASADGFLIRGYLERKRAYAVAYAAAPPANRTTMQDPNVSFPPVMMRYVATGPMKPEERQAVIDIMTVSQMGTSDQLDVGQNPTWDQVGQPGSTIDPCLNRVAGAYCENGHLVSLQANAFLWSGKLHDTAWGKFTQIRLLDLSQNEFDGPIPASFCKLLNIQNLYMYSQQGGFKKGFTRLPECLSDLNRMRRLSFFGNSLTNLPINMRNMTVLNFVDFSYNQIAAIPSGLEAWTQVDYVDLSVNLMEGRLPDLRAWPVVSYFSVAKNRLTGPITTDAFDGLDSLELLDISANQFDEGPLPRLRGLSALTELYVQQNRFTEIPLEWGSNLPSLTNFNAAFNRISKPANALSTIVTLTSVDISHNQLTCDNGFGNRAEFSGVIASLVGPAVTSIILDYNEFNCPWISAGLGAASSLQILSLSHNGLTAMSDSLFDYNLLQVDLSYNNLTSELAYPIDSPSTMTYLNLQGNPRLTFDELPGWAVQDTTQLAYLGNYICPTVFSPSNRGMRMLVDPTFFQYRGCLCAKGTFGSPPLCEVVPLVADLSPFSTISSEGVASFDALVGTSHSLGRSPHGTINPNLTDLSFSDAWYGEDRLTLGISTSWSIHMEGITAGSKPLCTSKTTNSTSTDFIVVATENCLLPISQASSVASDIPVRMIQVRIHLNLGEFKDVTDSLTIHEGPGDLSGDRIFALRGSDMATMVIAESYTDAAGRLVGVPSDYKDTFLPNLPGSKPYDDAYGSMLNFNSSVLLTVNVFTPTASITFQSRDTKGTHLFVTYSYSFVCPSATHFYSDADGRCMPLLETFHVKSELQAAIFASAAVALVLPVLFLGMVLWFWHTSIIRAASRPFLLMLLGCLFLMAFGSLFYAASPISYLDSGDTTTSDALCTGRVWFAALPLVAILAVLLAKNNRISSIFNSGKLEVKSVTDWDLLRSVVFLCMVEVVLLAIHSGMPISRPQINEGSGTLTGKWVASCSQENGFGAWLGVQLAYVGVLMLAGAFLAFRTRNLPSQFNESAHIGNALMVLIFFAVLIVPLDLLIQDNPEASMLIQGIGQALLSILLTTILFAPKAYLLLVGVGNQTEHTQQLHTNVSTGAPSNAGPTQLQPRGSTVRASTKRPSAIPLPRTVPRPNISIPNSESSNANAGPSSPVIVPDCPSPSIPTSPRSPRMLVLHLANGSSAHLEQLTNLAGVRIDGQTDSGLTSANSTNMPPSASATGTLTLSADESMVQALQAALAALEGSSPESVLLTGLLQRVQAAQQAFHAICSQPAAHAV